jgi:hypothetical protein
VKTAQPAALALALGLALGSAAAPPQWTLLVANDTCPDYTWGDDEPTTRRDFAELVRAHLDEMTRTDAFAPGARDHYTMITQEALCFLERYPEREAELVQRLREGRLLLSPNLCNTLWGFQSIEAGLRNFYPARRLERRWELPPAALVHHIEYPGLPWGVVSLLSGCGVRWLTMPYLSYDSNFAQLQAPPVFRLEGPDGSRINVLLDRFACERAGYTQGSYLLDHPDELGAQWIPHYRDLGAAYPVRTILAAGTHGDTHPSSAGQTPGFAARIAALDSRVDAPARIVNGTYAQFAGQIDAVEARQPFLGTQRGSLGDAWSSWPVAWANSVADLRENERQFLASETLLALASLRQPGLGGATQAERARAEWCWTMLGDHAWNGTDPANQAENLRLRRAWNTQLACLSVHLRGEAWEGLGLAADAGHFTLFNSLGAPRRELVRIPTGTEVRAIRFGSVEPAAQDVVEDGQHVLYFVSPLLAGFDFAEGELVAPPPPAARPALRATPTELENASYRLRLDPATGGIASLVFKPTGDELVVPRNGRTLGQSLHFDGSEHTLTDVNTAVVAAGPVLARLRVDGGLGALRVTSFITLYTALDRIDFDVRMHGAPTAAEQRLVQVFPMRRAGATLFVETPAAVVRPVLAPEGDYLPGADVRRCPVQGFLAVAGGGGPSVALAPLDSYLLRQDLDALSIEALGNDQDYKEVDHAQGGDTEFRFRYALRAHAGAYDNPATVAWSRAASTPLIAAAGRLAAPPAVPVVVDPARALVTCLKPADETEGTGLVLRLWETGGRSGALTLSLSGLTRARATDLLERDRDPLPVVNGRVSVPLAARGLASIRLER